jgi:hypothetical protein
LFASFLAVTGHDKRRYVNKHKKVGFKEVPDCVDEEDKNRK